VCWVFGHPEAANLAYLGLYALQHRGQESAACFERRQELHVHRRWASQEIFQPGAAQLRAAWPWPHALLTRPTRRSSTPAIMIDQQGQVALGHNGNLTMPPSGAASSSTGLDFQTNSDTE